MSKSFHIGDLLSITDGRLVSPNHIGGVYEICDYALGQEHMTHQLPRAARTLKPWLLEQHPWLADVKFELDIPSETTKEDAQRIVDECMAALAVQYGGFHDVEPMPFGAYVGREPIAELREMAPHAEIIQVEVPPSRD